VTSGGIALLLLALLAPRPGELRLSHWNEFDLDAAIWRVPAERMKMRRPHRVPLPPQAITLLRELHRHTGTSALLLRVCVGEKAAPSGPNSSPFSSAGVSARVRAARLRGLTNAPRWHDLAPGVRVQLRPLTTALMVATRSDPAVEAVPEDASDEERAVAFAKALARRAVLAWEGIGDANGNPIDPSPEAIDALLDVWPIFEAFQMTYVSKGLLLEQEKNVSALSPNGPSAGATATAKPARKPARTARRG